MSSYFENEQAFSFNNKFFRNQLLKNYKNTIFQFIKITKAISHLKLIFLLFFAFEVISSIYLSLYFSKSSVIAIAFGGIVLSIFAYFVVLFYFQTKKPEQIDDLRKRFVVSCRHAIAVPEGIAEHHLSVANALLKLSYYLYGIEYGYFPFVKKGGATKLFLEKLSCYMHQEDVFKMQEQLLFYAIDEHICQMKNTPTDLEVHVSLANNYVSLAKLYIEAQKKAVSSRFIKNNFERFKRKFEVASKRAIEEFIILKEFAPNDPWIHAQLAQCYHSLEMYEEEANEHEVMIDLSPNDNEIKFRLGKIYFTLGRNAEGLGIYEDLRKAGYKKAEEILSWYGSTRAIEELEDI